MTNVFFCNLRSNKHVIWNICVNRRSFFSGWRSYTLRYFVGYAPNEFETRNFKENHWRSLNILYELSRDQAIELILGVKSTCHFYKNKLPLMIASLKYCQHFIGKIIISGFDQQFFYFVPTPFAWFNEFPCMMTSSNGNIFRVTGPLWEEFTGHRWIPLTKASDAKLWRVLWSVLEQTIEQTIETPVIWDAIALIVTSV